MAPRDPFIVRLVVSSEDSLWVPGVILRFWVVYPFDDKFLVSEMSLPHFSVVLFKSRKLKEFFF